MRNVKVNAITLKKRDFKEKDRIVTVFTKEYGKYNLMAKGVQKLGSKLAGITEPISYSSLIVSNLKDLGVISSCDLKESFSNIHKNLNVLSHVLYILELTDKSTELEHPNEELFNALLSTLYLIEAGTNVDIAARYFEYSIINILGYSINTNSCQGCGCNLTDKIYYSAHFGGFFCETCNLSLNENIIFPQAILSYINVFDTYSVSKIKTLNFPTAVINDLSRLFKTHLAYRIDKQINSLEFIVKQKEDISSDI